MLRLINMGIVAMMGKKKDVVPKPQIFEFTEVGTHTFNVPNGTKYIEYVVVAGGGGGGVNGGSGGGAGGYRSSVVGEMSGGGATAESVFIPTERSYAVVVGAGGNGGIRIDSENVIESQNGSNSSFGNIVSIGGGGGRFSGATTLESKGDGKDGGSGSGAAYWLNSAVSKTFYGGAGIEGQGYKGGDATVTRANTFSSGGGGGAGGAGEDTTNGGRIGGLGGIGVRTNITGELKVLAVGATSDTNKTPADVGGAAMGINPQPNTGNGGSGAGGNGADGIVILKCYFEEPNCLMPNIGGMQTYITFDIEE